MRRRQSKLPPNQVVGGDSFFKPKVQPKLAMGTPGDKYEVEADRMADQVVNKTGGGDAVQKMEGEEEVQQKPLAASVTPLVQKMENAEEEAPVQKMEEEEPVQAMEEEEPVQAMEEEEPVQAMEEEEPVQAMEEEEPVQAMKEEEPVQAMEEEEVQTKKANTPTTNSNIEGKLRKGSGGSKMDSTTQTEMESGFGADFSNVNIHNDSEAAQMSQGIGAQAFTHGNDVYFNKGKYDPESKEGKHLLAHELTHTIQQGAAAPRKENTQKNDSSSISNQRSKAVQRRALTPAEERAAIASGRATFDRKSVRVLQIITGTAVDGALGPLTATAISNFQTAQGINDDGIVNQITLDRMVQNRVADGVNRHEHAIQLVLDFYNIASPDTLAFRFDAAAITLDFANFRIIPARTDFEPGGLRVINLSDFAFGSALILRNTIQGELARPAPAVVGPILVPNRLSASDVRKAISYTRRKYTDERSIRAIQGLTGATATGIIDAQTVQFIAEAQSLAGLTIDGKVGDETTEEFYDQIVANGNFNSAIRLLIDYYNLVDDDNLLQIFFDPTVAALAATDNRPNEPVRIRVGPSGMTLPFAGAVLNIAHELEHVKLLKQGLADVPTHEFLAESVEILSVNLPDDTLDPQNANHDAFIDDATRCIINWNAMPVNNQRKFRRKFFAVRREVLRRIDGGTPAQRLANAPLRAQYVAINPPN